jgi:hypothetical protein
VVGLAESAQGLALAQLLVDPVGTAVLAILIALPSIVEPSSSLVRGVDIRASTLHRRLLVTQPVKPVRVLLPPAGSAPKAAVGMFCVQPPPLPQEIVDATAADMP